MEDHEERILRHPDLAPAEQRDVEEQVEDRPEQAASTEGDQKAPAGRWGRAGYAVAVAVLALAALYGALRAASYLSQSQMDRLASLEGERLSVEGYSLRETRLHGGSASKADSTGGDLDQRYLRALRTFRAARDATLGLFPHYDAQQLRRAARQLETVAQEAEPGSFVQLEALFFLGKARLAQGDQGRATRALRRVVTAGGRLAPEARKILSRLYEEAAYTPSE